MGQQAAHSDTLPALNGGEAIVRTLELHDVAQVFCLAGESFLPVINALSESERIRPITTRLESETAFAALAQGSLTHRPGVAVVTRGPGACNASIAVHTAQQSSVPLVLFIGQVPSRLMAYEATQKIDYTAMFGSFTKAVFTPRSVQEMADMTAEALRVAVSGRPGPVIVDMPLDVLMAQEEVTLTGPQPAEVHMPAPEDVDALAERIAAAERPLVIAGERLGFEAATEALKVFAEKMGVGVLTCFRQQDLFPYDHPNYVGNLGLAHAPQVVRAWDEADLIISLGHRMNQETTRGFKADLLEGKTLLSVYPDAAVVAHPLYTPEVAVVADIAPVLEALVEKEYTISEAQAAWVAGHHEAQMAFMQAPEGTAKGAVDMADVVKELTAQVAEDSIIITDAGNFATWPQAGYPFSQAGTQLGPINGAMGYGVPAALGAKLAFPERQVIVFVGDGGFLMTGPAALGTALHENVAIKVILSNNNYYGTIYMHNVKEGSDNAEGLKLTNPDFAALAEAYPNCCSFTVEKTDEFASALKAALAHDGPALLHLKTDIRDIIAGKSLEEL